MTAQNTWNLVKRRYRLPAKVQMNFELGFPAYHIGKCRCIVNTVCDIKTKKIFLAQKGIVLSDTIPLGWFTSPVFIPWANVLNMAVSTDDPGTPELRPGSDEQAADPGYCTLRPQ